MKPTQCTFKKTLACSLLSPKHTSIRFVIAQCKPVCILHVEHSHNWYLGSRYEARPKIVCENWNITRTALLDSYVWEVLPTPLILQTWVPVMKLKELFRGCHFLTLNDLNLTMTRRIRELNSNGLLVGVKKLPNRWKCAIEARGDYQYIKSQILPWSLTRESRVVHSGIGLNLNSYSS